MFANPLKNLVFPCSFDPSVLFVLEAFFVILLGFFVFRIAVLLFF
jgi:hypothetical protein